MGDCTYCGKYAGFLRGEHRKCREKHELALIETAINTCVDAALRGIGLDGLKDRVSETIVPPDAIISDSGMEEILALGWKEAFATAANDGVLTAEEKRGLSLYRSYFRLSEDRLNDEGHFDAFRTMPLNICVDAALRGTGLDGLKERIRATWASIDTPVSDSDLESNIVAGWTHAMAAVIEDHVLTSEEKRRLNRYRRHFGISEHRLNSEGHFDAFRMMSLLGSIAEAGIIPRYDRKSAREKHGRLPFNLMKSEELLWVFTNVGYMKRAPYREFTDSSMGAGIRVAKGVYLPPSSLSSRSVAEQSWLWTDDRGMMGVTTKHIYFAGSHSWFRVRLEKMVSFEPYRDGLGIMRDTASAKPETFIMGETDSWFAINLIDALLDMEDITLPKKDAPTLDEIVDEAWMRTTTRRPRS